MITTMPFSEYIFWLWCWWESVDIKYWYPTSLAHFRLTLHQTSYIALEQHIFHLVDRLTKNNHHMHLLCLLNSYHKNTCHILYQGLHLWRNIMVCQYKALTICRWHATISLLYQVHEDYVELQEDINMIHNWSVNKHLMTFHVNACSFQGKEKEAFLCVSW